MKILRAIRPQNKKQSGTRSAKFKWISASVIFLGITASAVLSAFLLSAGLLALGFTAFALFALSEFRRRGFWEQAWGFRLQKIKEDQNNTNKELASLKLRLLSLKKQMGETQDYVYKIKKPVSATTKTKKRSSPANYIDLVDAEPQAEAEAEAEAEPKTETTEAANPFLPPENLDKALANFDIRAANDPARQYYPELSDLVIQELLQHAIQSEEVTVFLQPVVRLPQRKIRCYEMFARIRVKSGVYLPAAQYLKMARKNALLRDIEQLLLLKCLQTVQSTAHLEKAIPFVLNIEESTLKNASYMKQLLTFLSRNRDLASRLIFEMEQADYNKLKPAVLQIIEGLGTLGCTFSLDHVSNLNINITDLLRYRVRFLKIDAVHLSNIAKNETEFTIFTRLKSKLESNGIAMIAEKVEDEKMLRGLMDFDFHYGQGYLFGKPDLQGAYKKRKAA